MPGQNTHKLESRLLGETSSLRYADDITLMAESKEELKSVLRRTKEESEKAVLKLNIQEIKIITSGPIMANKWRKSGNNNILFSWAAKLLQMVTAVKKLKDTCSLEGKL